MQISVSLLLMTAAPSNVKKREIHKGGYPVSKIESFAPGHLARGFFVVRKKGAAYERLPASADRSHAEAGDGLQGHRQEDKVVTGQRTELLQVAPPCRLRPGSGDCL